MGRQGKRPVGEDGNRCHQVGQGGLYLARLAGPGYIHVPILLDRPTLKEEVHPSAAGAAGDQGETEVDCNLDPLDTTRDTDECESQRPFDGDECEAPELLENIEPLLLLR